uniref:Uncharacterized protein n=1 Tax=Vespula pensylvanica TaxID=30213 RepID=A0A834P2T6_VESPE|nr:hypothetical protein H0235_008201 [Vespula pensylvanica]
MADCFRGRLRRKIFRLEPTRTAANVGVCLLNFGLALLVNTRVYDGNSANNSDVPESITKSEIGGRRNRMKGMATEREKGEGLREGSRVMENMGEPRCFLPVQSARTISSGVGVGSGGEAKGLRALVRSVHLMRVKLCRSARESLERMAGASR